MNIEQNTKASGRRGIAFTVTSSVLSIALIIATLEIARRNVIPFVADQQRYIVSLEVALLGIFLTEALARIISISLRAPERKQVSARLRLGIRVIGYSVALVTVISILAANPTLGLSIGAIVGLVIAFATQNIISNVLAAILIFNTRLIKIGEEISVTGLTGRVIDIRLSHTVIAIDDDVVYIPNTLMITSAVRRKKRNGNDEETS